MSLYYFILLMSGASLIFYHPNQVGEEEKRLKAKIEENYERAITLEEQRDLKLKLADEILRDENEAGMIECHSDIDKDEQIEMQQLAANGTLLTSTQQGNGNYADMNSKYQAPKLQQPLMQ